MFGIVTDCGHVAPTRANTAGNRTFCIFGKLKRVNFFSCARVPNVDTRRFANLSRHDFGSICRDVHRDYIVSVELQLVCGGVLLLSHGNLTASIDSLRVFVQVVDDAERSTHVRRAAIAGVTPTLG